MNVFIAHIQDKGALLNAEESFHCARVLRYKPGQLVYLTNGNGLWCKGQLTLVHEKQCVAQVLETELKTPRCTRLHLAIAPTKQIDRIEWMLEKAIEIGLEEISFLHCQNNERVVIKPERLQKIAESAMKQSLQAFLPKVNPLIKFGEALHLKADQRYIAHCERGEKVFLSTLDFKNKTTLVLIGPEGDFSDSEITLAVSKGFQPLDLGSNRLRTETAGLTTVVAAALQV